MYYKEVMLMEMQEAEEKGCEESQQNNVVT